MTGSSTSTSSWMLLPMLLALLVISSFSAPATNNCASARSARSARSALSADATNKELEALKVCSDESSKTQLNISVSQSNSSIQYFIEGIKLLNCTKSQLIPKLSERLERFCQNIMTSGCVETPYPSLIGPKEFHEKLKTLFQCYNSGN